MPKYRLILAHAGANNLDHYPKGHPKAGQFMPGDGDHDGIVDDHAHRSKKSQGMSTNDLKSGVQATSAIAKGANTMYSQSDKLFKSKKKNPRADLSNMSDKELREVLNRETMERQYDAYFNAPQESKGKEYFQNTMAVVGTAATVVGTALSIALAVKQLKGDK